MQQKKSIDFTILALGLVLILALLASCSQEDKPTDKTKARLKHTIYDSDKEEFITWNNEITVRYIDTTYRPGDVVSLSGDRFLVLSTDSKSYSDYGLEVTSDDTLRVWDGNRLVGAIPLDNNSEIGHLINKDNEKVN